jgi:hypothetical protein
MPPRQIPNGQRAFGDLIKRMLLQNRNDFQNKGLESRFENIWVGPPDGGVGEVFGLDYAMQPAVGLFYNPPGRQKLRCPNLTLWKGQLAACVAGIYHVCDNLKETCINERKFKTYWF